MIIIHCTAGKDRAGIAAALILKSLGVYTKTVLADYLLTNNYWNHSNYIRPGMDIKTANTISSARKIYSDAAFAAIKKQHNSVQNYFRNEIGLHQKEQAVLQKMYLE